MPAFDTCLLGYSDPARLPELLAAADSRDLPGLLALLGGHPPERVLTLPALRRAVFPNCGLPDWLIERCRREVGDAVELCARLWPREGPGLDLSLADVTERLLPELRSLSGDPLAERLRGLWDRCDTPQRVLLNRLLTGRFPDLPPRAALAGALAERWTGDPSRLEAALTENPRPDAETLERWRKGQTDLSPDPYPFLEPDVFGGNTDALGPARAWQTEWQWNGLRTQCVVRGGRVFLWTRDALVTDRYPLLAAQAAELLDGTVLDGCLLPWREESPLPLRELTPENAVYLAWDCLEIQGVDIRTMPLYSRLQQALPMLGSLDLPGFRMSEPLPLAAWEDLAALRGECRTHCARGLILKQLESDYARGRTPANWLVLPGERREIIVELMYGLLTGAPEYTFGRRENAEWIPVVRLPVPDPGMEQRLTAYIREYTVERKGPVRVVAPGLAARVSYEDRAPSSRHKSGFVLENPRLEELLQP